jgi:hypothetical protein
MTSSPLRLKMAFATYNVKHFRLGKLICDCSYHDTSLRLNSSGSTTGTRSTQAIEASDPERDTQDITIEPDAGRGIDCRMVSIDRLV